jgi:ubiquinone/menaquinone biosynthesis C-methylase UbiE
VTDELQFRADLYRGTAAFYDEFRVPYPRALTDDVLRRTRADGTGRLLDLACGTGQVTFALCEHFAQVCAVDQEAETIAFARDKADRVGVHNVEWIAQRAEDVDADASFDLVACGNGFHRLRRRLVAERALRWLRPGGHLALIWCTAPWMGEARWQRALRDITGEWTERLDSADRVPANFEAHLTAHPHVDVVRDAGFDIVGHFSFPEPHEWMIDTLIGFVYSTGFLSRAAFGDRSDEFEADTRARLGALEPSGVFHELIDAAYDLARVRS